MNQPSSERGSFARALYPGRFQPFHVGHLEAVRHVLGESSEIIVMIGSASQSHTVENPFTAGERTSMIKLALDEAGVNPSRHFIVPVTDLQVHSIWVSHVCSLVPKFDVIYSNEPLTRRLFIEAGFTVKPIPFFKRKLCSATEIRKRMLRDSSWEKLLPNSVAGYIREVQGVERLRDLMKTDKVEADI